MKDWKENWTTNKEIILILNYLGYIEASVEYKMKWVGCKTIEKLEKITPMYIPLFICEKQEPLFGDTIDILLDWDKLISICNELKIKNITTDRIEAIKTIASVIKPIIY